MNITPKETREAMKLYKAEGHTNKEVALKFNVNYETTKAICRGIAHQKCKHEINQTWLPQFKKLHGDAWEVVGEFISVDARIDIKCKHCGTVRDYPCASVRKGRKNITCFKCKSIEEEQKAIEREIEKQKKKKQLELKRKLQAEEKQKKEEAKWHECPVCGKLTNRPKYCSDKCCNKIGWKNNEIRRRSLIKEQLVDEDITLEKLYERDNGVCWLCGLKCNWNDFEYQDNWFIAGNFYPSVDHIKPLSKGGKHSWTNIRLAHRRCNSVKKDN